MLKLSRRCRRRQPPFGYFRCLWSWGESPDGIKKNAYFSIPSEFWRDEHFATMSWPALAVLLILLKETQGRPSAELAVDRARDFYGISRTSAEVGLNELRNADLLMSKTRWVADPDARGGRREASLHALLGPYATSNRVALQSAANKRRTASPAAPAASRSKVVIDEHEEAPSERED